MRGHMACVKTLRVRALHTKVWNRVGTASRQVQGWWQCLLFYCDDSANARLAAAVIPRAYLSPQRTHTALDLGKRGFQGICGSYVDKTQNTAFWNPYCLQEYLNRECSTSGKSQFVIKRHPTNNQPETKKNKQCQRPHTCSPPADQCSASPWAATAPSNLPPTPASSYCRAWCHSTGSIALVGWAQRSQLRPLPPSCPPSTYSLAGTREKQKGSWHHVSTVQQQINWSPVSNTAFITNP